MIEGYTVKRGEPEQLLAMSLVGKCENELQSPFSCKKPQN